MRRALLGLLALCGSAAGVYGQTAELEGVDLSGVRQSAIAFVTTTTAPGVEGGGIEVDRDGRSSEAWRSSLGFAAEFILPETIYNGYWGVSLVAGGLDDRIAFVGEAGPTEVMTKRDVLGLRGSLGLSFPITERWRVRPSVTLLLADLDSQFEVVNDSPLTTQLNREADATVVSGMGSLDVIYNRWYGDSEVELTGHYSAIYTDTTSDDNKFLDTWAWSQTAQLRGRLLGPTDWTLRGRPWRWLAYANYTNFLDLDEQALGYTSTLEFGVGLEWQMTIKPMDWFGWRSIGWRAGYITGDDVSGFNVGLTAR